MGQTPAHPHLELLSASPVSEVGGGPFSGKQLTCLKGKLLSLCPKECEAKQD